MLPEYFIYIGVLINLFLTIWYIKSILKGGTKPNLVSWFIWSLAPFVGVYLGVKAGAGLSILGVFMSGFGPLLVLLIFIWKRSAYWKLNIFDFFCGFLSIFALILYIATKNPWLSIMFAIASDALAYVPTLIKTWKYPETEHLSTYTGGIINNIIALLIIKDWTFSIYAFNLYLVLINIIEVIFIYRKKMLYFKHEKDEK